MEKHAEILAPAGGEAQLRAAVLCGADAVYLGLRGFNARAGAENFDENTLPQTVGWCHARGVRVYVTLNTLVTDRELPQWLHSLDAVAAAGVDGVLVQDLGLAKIIRQRYPTLPLHASTQMTIHNLAGARLLEEMGFAQVVLARLPAIYRFDLFCSEDISNLIRYERDLFVIVESNGSDFGYGLALQGQTGDRELLHPQDTLAKPYLKVLLKTDYEHIEQNNLQQFYEQIFDMGYSPGRTFGKVLVSAQEQGLTNFYEAWIELISA